MQEKDFLSSQMRTKICNTKGGGGNDGIGGTGGDGDGDGGEKK